MWFEPYKSGEDNFYRWTENPALSARIDELRTSNGANFDDAEVQKKINEEVVLQIKK